MVSDGLLVTRHGQEGRYCLTARIGSASPSARQIRCAKTVMIMNTLMARSGPEVPNAHLDG